MRKINSPIFILSSAIGIAGGADKATKLLVEEYLALGYSVYVFATSCEISIEHPKLKIVAPFVRKGYRWNLPHRSLVFRLFLVSLINKPIFVHCIGLTIEVRYALQYISHLKLLVWETTEAILPNKFIDKKIPPLLGKASMMLAPSNVIKENIKESYHYQGVIKILPFWIENNARNQLNAHIRKNKILYVGRLDLDKGFDCLFDALRIINDNPAIEVTICGRGNSQTIKNMCNDLGNVHVYGWVDESKVHTLINEADYFILPSKHEGYPLSLLEACSYSKPFMATSVGSIPEVFSNTPCALLFERGNPIQLSEILKLVYHESDEIYSGRCLAAKNQFHTINNLSLIRLRLKDLVDELKR